MWFVTDCLFREAAGSMRPSQAPESASQADHSRMEEESASAGAPADRLPPAFASENRKCRHRLRIVGSNAYGCVVNSSRVVWLGGSSNVFRKMFAEAWFIRSASW